MEKVTDINHGVPYSHKISPQGEMITNYTGYASAGVNFRKNLSTKEIAVIVRNAIKKLGFIKKNGFNISLISDYNHIKITIKQVPYPIFTNEYIEYYNISNPEDKMHWIKSKNCNIQSTKEINTWDHFLFNSDSAKFGRYTIQAKFLRNTLEKILNSYKYDDSDGMIDYFRTNFYGAVVFDWNLEKSEVQK